MLQSRHIIAATLAHVAFFLFIVFASDYAPSRPMPQPTIIEAVMLDETPEQIDAERERLAEEQREREREDQRRREAEERQRQEEEARRRAETEAQARREREREEARRQEQREEERRRQEAEEQRRRDEQAEQQRREREEAERREREEAERRRQEEEERRRQEAERQRQEEERRRQEEERRQREEQERRRALQEQIEREERERRERAAVAAWQPQMSRHIERFWRRPPELSTARDLSVRLRVSILPDGTVTGVQVLESSGNISFDRSAERAVQAASPLPQPDGGFFFREFTTVFQPE